MQSSAWQPQIPLISTGQDLSAAVINPSLSGLTDRTQYLFDRFTELTDRSVMLAYDQLVADVANGGVMEYSVVYYSHNETPNYSGIALASPQLADDGQQIRPANSTFVYGIVKSLVGSKADVWLQGLVEAEGIVAAVIDSSTDNEEVVSGPLYLSNTEPGKLTFFPGGFAVYVGFAKDADTILLNPSFESTNSLFQTFKFMLLDRPIGEPIKGDDDLWTIDYNSVDTHRVGWMPVDSMTSHFQASGITVPSNDWNESPSFFYNIPVEADIETDGGLQDHEKLVAKYFKRALPPSPTNFTILARNGLIQMSREDGIVETSTTTSSTTTDTSTSSTTTSSTTTAYPWVVTSDGLYHVTKDGVWWYGNEDDTIPWSKDLDYGASADNWKNDKGTPETRVRLMIIFSRLNQDLKDTMVTSLAPFKDTSNDSSNVVKFISAGVDQVEATTGDLLLKFELPVSTSNEDSTVAQAVRSLSYDAPTGALVAAMGDTVTNVKGLGSISATKDANGLVVVASMSTTTPVMLSALEPENSRLELLNGINTSLTLDNSRRPCGFLGKIVLPSELLPGWSIRIKLICAGKNSAGNLASSATVPLTFSYNVMKVGTVLAGTTIPDSTETLTLPNGYVSLTSFLSPDSSFVIPASAFAQAPNAIINFRINWAAGAGSYTGNLGVLACYWHFVAP